MFKAATLEIPWQESSRVALRAAIPVNKFICNAHTLGRTLVQREISLPLRFRYPLSRYQTPKIAQRNGSKPITALRTVNIVNTTREKFILRRNTPVE